MLDRDQERDEWVACIADDDSQVDGHRQFARFSHNRIHEDSVNEEENNSQGTRMDYRCEGGRKGVEDAMK